MKRFVSVAVPEIGELVCESCGSFNIEAVVYVDVNTGEQTEDTPDPIYCPACNDRNAGATLEEYQRLASKSGF